MKSWRVGVGGFIAALALAGGASAQTVWINEFHYDNPGTDSNEAVEVAGVAGTSLTTYRIALYNGEGSGSGTVYQVITLSGTIDDEGCGYGAVSNSASSIQNGPNDGLALYTVNAGVTTLVQFLSYEGSLFATSGPAAGVLSENMGAPSTVTNAFGLSHQLAGSGTNYAAFSWVTNTFSFGSLNVGQTISPCSGSSLPPAIQPIANRTVTNLNAVSFDVVALDNAEQDQVTLSWDGNPAGATFTTVTNVGGVTNTFTWSSATPPGVYTATFFAADNDGVSTQAVTITVVDPPVLTITTLPITVPYSTLAIQIEGTASTNVIGVLRWTNAVGGVGGTIDAATNWAIPAVTLGLGANTIVVRGSNAFSAVATASVVITRSQPLLPGCTDLITSQGFEAGDLWSIADGSANVSTEVGATDSPDSQRIASGSASWQVNNGNSTLELASVSIAGYTGRYVSIRVSGVATNAGTAGLDGGDRVRVFVALDGGSFGATPSIDLGGNSNARWGFWATNSYTAWSFDTATVAAPQGSLSTNNYSTLNVLIPDGATSVAIRVIANNDTANEVWNIDDVRLVGCLAGPPPADSDGDGILDTWELSFFGSLTNAGVGTDVDGDRFIDQHEFRAGTIPTDSNSLLIATSTLPGGAGVVIRWQSATNKNYILSATTNLVSAPFTAIQSNIAATPPINAVTVAAPASATSFRIDLQE